MCEVAIDWVGTTAKPLICGGCLAPINSRTMLVVSGLGQFHDERCVQLHGRWLAKMARLLPPPSPPC